MIFSIERTITVNFSHRVYFTRSVFSPQNQLLLDLLTPPDGGGLTKVLVVVDQGVANAFPNLLDQISIYMSSKVSSIELVHSPLVLPGGEAVKQNAQLVQFLYSQIAQFGICRHSYVLAVGGGALLDLVGFIAATAHRGVRYGRLPTTTLAQADAGVGVKNGINAFGKKNFIGTFSPPFFVINDADFLQGTDQRGGIIESIKVALIRDALFFSEIERLADRLSNGDRSAMEQIIQRSAELHVQHIAESGDPFEFASARPLDFGHWAAHKLEQMSRFALSHGEAVVLGLVLDTLYSRGKGMLSASDTDRIMVLLKKLGFTIFSPLMKMIDMHGNWTLLEGLQEFREHIGGELTVTMLAGIGKGIEVHEMDSELIKECVRELEKCVAPLS